MHSKIIEYIKAEIARNGRFSQPFRDRFQHTMRVYNWAERLQSVEGGDLSVIQIACLFHDSGWDAHLPHEEVSAALAKDYLTKNGYVDLDIDKVVQAVLHHNRRTSDISLPIECYVVMDADLLDEIGAVTIVWDSMATALAEEPCYLKAYNRICHYLEKNKERASLLKTESGKNFYKERIEFIEYFIANLEFELD